MIAPNHMKQCNNCTTQFEPRSEERAFYQKIRVPEPQLCADCRLQRKLAFRNERTLYRRTCSNCKKMSYHCTHQR